VTCRNRVVRRVAPEPANHYEIDGFPTMINRRLLAAYGRSIQVEIVTNHSQDQGLVRGRRAFAGIRSRGVQVLILAVQSVGI
jgi:hypothetical protein